MRLPPVPMSLLLALAATPAAAEDALFAADFGAAYGRYAPAGDCRREPQIVVEAGGFVITAVSKNETLRNPEVAWSYGGNF